MKASKWIVVILTICCLAITGCAKIMEDMSSDTGPHDMDWFYKNNGYAIMTVMDMQNRPVMEVIAIPLNSEAMFAVVHGEIKDADNYIKTRVKRQRAVMFMSVHAHRDCVFFWPNFMLEQGQSRVYPASVIPSQSPLLAAVDRLYKKYGETRVREVDATLGLFTNPYTGRDMLELEKEKRKEYLECWRDLMFLKKYLLASLKDYWDMTQKRKLLSHDLSELTKNENPEGR